MYADVHDFEDASQSHCRSFMHGHLWYLSKFGRERYTWNLLIVEVVQDYCW